MILAALPLLLAAADTPEKPLPPVVMSPQAEREFLNALPLITVDGRRFRIFAIRGTGSRDVLDQAAQKLSSEGWKCDVSIDRNGILSLAVYASNRTLTDVQQLAGRFSAHEFGAIEAQPMLFPDLGSS